jgi:hypothetical protein
MTRSKTKSVAIAATREQNILSKGQKAFNKLIKQIEQLRVRLAAWEAAMPPYQNRFSGEMLPLIEAAELLQVELVHRLDWASEQKGLNKTERRMLTGLLTELAGQLAAKRKDEALKAIYNKHSESDFDAEEAAEMEGLRSMLEGELGVELGDDLDFSSPEKILRHAQERMREQQAAFEAKREAREAKRTKSAKQIAREAQQEAEAQEVSQSIREVYRKLASVLHPDREPDPAERERKNVLMQRANKAYDSRNLLQLLELQLELEHIDQAAINKLSEDRLKHYNKILKEQLAELEMEILHVEAGFRARFNISDFSRMSPATIVRELEIDILRVRQANRDLETELVAFDDIKRVKSWLKEIRHQARSDAFYFDDTPF